MKKLNDRMRSTNGNVLMSRKAGVGGYNITYDLTPHHCFRPYLHLPHHPHIFLELFVVEYAPVGGESSSLFSIDARCRLAVSVDLKMPSMILHFDAQVHLSDAI